MTSLIAFWLQTSHVPQHLLLMATVLRYIMQQTDLLRKPELDSFLITAFSPELMDADYLATAKLDQGGARPRPWQASLRRSGLVNSLGGR